MTSRALASMSSSTVAIGTVGGSAGGRPSLRILPGSTESPDTAPERAQPLPAEGSDRTALAAYLAQLRRYPLLDRDEEHEIAVRYARTGDPAAARQLVTANLRLVVKIARDHQHVRRNLLDLIQEGNLGLVQAVRKYDPDRGVKLSTYAAWWIRAFMLKFILDNCRMVKIGTTQAQRRLFFNLRKQRNKLEHAGVAAEPKALAASLGVRESEVIEMEGRLANADVSPEALGPLSSDGFWDSRTTADDRTRPDVRVEEHEFHHAVGDLVERFSVDLPERERYILRARLWGETEVTLEEVGRRFRVSRERARQIELRLKGWLREYLVARLGTAVGGPESAVAPRPAENVVGSRRGHTERRKRRREKTREGRRIEPTASLSPSLPSRSRSLLSSVQAC